MLITKFTAKIRRTMRLIGFSLIMVSKWCDVNGKINYNGGLPCTGKEGKHQNLVYNQGSNSHWPCFGHGETLSFENNYRDTTIPVTVLWNEIHINLMHWKLGWLTQRIKAGILPKRIHPNNKNNSTVVNAAIRKKHQQQELVAWRPTFQFTMLQDKGFFWLYPYCSFCLNIIIMY